MVGSRGLEEAWKDLQAKLASGYPTLFYGQIPYLLVYAAAGVNIQFGRLLPLGQVFCHHVIIVLVGTVQVCMHGKGALSVCPSLSGLYQPPAAFWARVVISLVGDQISPACWIGQLVTPLRGRKSFNACLMFNPACIAGRTCGPCLERDAPCGPHLVVSCPGEYRATPGSVGEACS